MNIRGTASNGLGKARRFLALVSLALFVHAVALHALHGHVAVSSDHSDSYGTTFSTSHEAPAHEQHSVDTCPACQLQHGFIFLKATPSLLIVGVTGQTTAERSTLAALHRIADGPSSSRAPPTL